MPCGETQGECQQGVLRCSNNGIYEGNCEGFLGPVNEICGNLVDDDCDGETDETPPCTCMAGETRLCGSFLDFEGNPVGTCSAGTQTCTTQGVWGECIDAVGPEAEYCDYKDNDCDGLTDENVLNDCGECGTLPVEVCDEIDNDCDGQTDEDVLNQCGECGEVQEEVCDGKDNDCDGLTDENLLNACDECGALPTEICDGTDNDCDGQTDENVLNACGECGTLPIEVCDGTDNDCDGQTDENVLNTCGECGEIPVEICDEKDNDCDGQTDENVLNDCGGCKTLEGSKGELCDGEDKDLCNEGYWVCNDTELICDDTTDDNLELCDGKDNDCNSETEDGTDEATFNEPCDGNDDDPCLEGEYKCNGTNLYCNDETDNSIEICGNNKDDNCDGVPDYEDPECTCIVQEDCGGGLNASGYGCPRLGPKSVGINSYCAPLCRGSNECTQDLACRPLPGSTSFGTCQPAGSGNTGDNCTQMSDCAVTDCFQGTTENTCRDICQSESDCPGDDIECGIFIYNTEKMGGVDQPRLTSICRPVEDKKKIGESCIDSVTGFDSANCSSMHCDILPYAHGIISDAPCEQLCAGRNDCKPTQICGVVYYSAIEGHPSTDEDGGMRYNDAILGCYTSIDFFGNFKAPGTLAIGQSCMGNQYNCASHHCLEGLCTDFCDEDSDCPGNWTCQYAELNMNNYFLAAINFQDPNKHALVNLCAPPQ